MRARHSLLIPATILALLIATSSAAAQAAWSDAFDQPGLGASARTFTLGSYRNELVAGTFRRVSKDGHPLMGFIAHFDGERWLPFGKGVNALVRSVLEWNGSLYVAGGFSKAGGLPAPGVARWDGQKWHRLGAGLNREVFALAVFQGQLHAAGTFDRSGTRVVRRIARFDGTRWLELGGGIHRSPFAPWVRTLLANGKKLYAAAPSTMPVRRPPTTSRPGTEPAGAASALA